jgi:hypothetical protein
MGFNAQLEGRLSELAVAGWSFEPIVRRSIEEQTDLMPSDLNTASQHTPHVPSVSSRTVRRGPHRPPGFGLGIRARTFIKRAELDKALTDGADPRESRELALRAQQLAKPRTRVRFAGAIERTVDHVGSPEPQILLGVYRRRPVLKNRALLLALADRLRAEAPVRLRGLAMADLLLYCGDSPLYGAESAVELERVLSAVLRALEPETVDPILAPARVPDTGNA